MSPTTETETKLVRIIFGICLLLLAGTSIYLFLQNQTQSEAIVKLETERVRLLTENASTTKLLLSERDLASTTIHDLASRLSLSAEELEDIERDLRREKNRNEEFEDQIRDLAGTITVLDKLSKTDEELLQKYSRTYFLNENFIPLKLSKIDNRYLMPGKAEQYFHGDAIDFLTDLLEDAKDDGHDLRVISGYRSFDEQQALKGQFTQVYGSGSNAFSADQGYSEHQLGTAIDMTDLATGGTFQTFAETEAYDWLLENAYKYGFILSYPPDNEFYIFEPWHWRFVGRDLARDLHKDEQSFYDLSQRELDAYLITIFD